MADIIMGLSAAIALFERKSTLRALQRLALTLLVAAEHQRFFGRIQVQPDNVPEFLFKVRVVGNFESFQPMRLDVVPVPNALHGAPAHPSLTGHRTNTPPDSSLRRSSGSFKHQGDFLRCKSLFAPPSRRIFKTSYSLLVKAL